MLTSYSTFIERIESEYKSQRNYYALAYDGNEVIDAVSVDASGVDESATHAQPPPPLSHRHPGWWEPTIADAICPGSPWQRCPLHQPRLSTQPRGAQAADHGRRL